MRVEPCVLSDSEMDSAIPWLLIMETVTECRSAMLAVLGACAVSWLCPDKAFPGSENGYWAFRPAEAPARPEAPVSWSRTIVDAFVWEALKREGLRPVPQAPRERLLRRLYLDLTGLPPTPEQAATFLEDESPHAYERLVESLLASPHYGERWAQKWLDVVRYADTNGFELDADREHAWRYRDYVVQSFNADKPYDLFVREQVAGDELFPGDQQALVATGFHGAGPRHVVGGNQDKEEARQEVLMEMTLGVGQALLGLTVQCARCHDHKFDPISQEDYYRLESFFGSTDIKDVPTAGPDEKAAYDKAIAAHEQLVEPIKKQLEDIEAPYNKLVKERKRAELEPQFVAALELAEDLRDEEQKRLAKEAASQIKPVWYDIVPLMSSEVKARRAKLRQRLHKLELSKPDPPSAAYAAANLDDAPRTYILQGGDFRRKGRPVEPDFPAALGRLEGELPEEQSGRRAALAEWLTDSSHPLTARVMVNRIWEFRMGRGLMADPNNFGVLGGTPTHPELLDWLALRFVRDGWSVKAMDRLIVLSSVYRLSSAIDPQLAEADPENKWYWRAHRRRLSGEVIRDSVLMASGRLNRSLEGKPVRIPIEPEVYDLIFTEAEPDNLWPVTPDTFQHDRRSIYLLNKRTVRLPFLANFDQPDTMTSCSVRPTSTHALQSLSLLNSDFMQDQSRSLADRVLARCGDVDTACQTEQAYLLTLARPPTPDERRLASDFLTSRPESLRDLSLALLNRNEFIYRP